MPTVVCQKHGLRYDPETQIGCVVCRREAAAAAPAATPAAPAEDGLGKPLAVAAAIWLASALVLFAAHREMASVYLAEDEPEYELDFDPNRQPSVGPQTDAALDELEALAREREERTGSPGAPLGLPTHDELSQDAERLDQIQRIEGAEPEPVEFEPADGSGASPEEPAEEPPPG
jgi:hypothetical protein